MNIVKKQKEFEKKQEELNAEIEVYNFFKLFGVEQHLKHILSPLDRNPTITFKVDNKKEFYNFIKLIKPSLLPFFIRKSGCTYFEPILKTDFFENNLNCFESKGLFKLDTQSSKYNSENLFKVVCWIERNENQYFQIWLDVPLNILPEDSFFNDVILDKYETEKARQYNKRHPEIKTNVPIIKGLDKIKFYGGHYSHFATTEDENKILNKLMGVQ